VRDKVFADLWTQITQRKRQL